MLAGLYECRMEPEIIPDSNFHPVILCSPDYGIELPEVTGSRFLNEYMFSRINCSESDRGKPVIRGRDNYQVDIFSPDNIMPVRICINTGIQLRKMVLARSADRSATAFK